MFGEQATGVVVYPHAVGDRTERGIDYVGEFVRRHIEGQRAFFGLTPSGLGLHRQMNNDFFARCVGEARYFFGVWCKRQKSDGEHTR